MALVIMLSVLLAMIFSGCSYIIPNCSADDEDGNENAEPRALLSHLAYKSDSTIFNIYDVELDFYFGSENAYSDIDNTSRIGMDFSFIPTTTYLFFAHQSILTPKFYNDALAVENGEVVFNRLLDEVPTIDSIEEHSKYHIVEKFINIPNEKNFYNTYMVQIMFESSDNPKDAWGGGAALYEITESYQKGVFVPDNSKKYTIPYELFDGNKGWLFFGMVTYVSENCEAVVDESGNELVRGYERGDRLEYREIIIYYEKNGAEIILSRYYDN
jgi:hypothetical protein